MYRIINPQEIQQAVARDEKWVTFSERVKISSTNIKLETIVPQKEETFQVVIDLIKNSTCFKAFTIPAYVLEIFMQQFWYTIKKIQGTDSYEFLLASKKFIVNAEVFRTILDIYPRVDGVDFTDVPDDNIALAFLIDLGYKGPLYKHTNMFVDHMHQPWKTLATIINKCLSGKTASNDKLQKSRINIMWGHEYGLSIPDAMLNDTIKQSESYQMFIKYSTGYFPPKKSRGKGSQGKKTVYDSQETVEVSEEFEPEPAKKRTTSKRRVKKSVTRSAKDNIIHDPDTALELGKSISLTEAKEAEAARKVHATYARIMTESIPTPTRKVHATQKLKGVRSLTSEEQEAPDKMKALKGSRKTNRRQRGIGGLNEGTGSKPGVPNEPIVISATLSEGTGAKPGVLNEETDISKEKVILERGDEKDSEYSNDDKDDDADKEGNVDDEGDDYISDTHDADDKDDETESDEDEIYKYKIRVRIDEDERMLDAQVSGFDKGDEEVSDAAKADAEKTSEDYTDAEINSLMDIKIQSEVLQIQSPTVLRQPVSVIAEPSVLTPILETPSAITVTTSSPPSVSTIPPLRIANLEEDVIELKKIDIFAEAFAALKTHVPTVVDNYLRTKVGDVF
ncbi:hypothetical protein Tco_0538428 [Tanacetum coccineum]